MNKQLFAGIILLIMSIPLHAQEATDTIAKVKTIGVVKTVREEPVATYPTANLTQLLQGRAAGLSATLTNGRPGSPALLLIRGQNSIDSDSEPLYLLNGAPITATQLSSINIEDVQYVTVLKDAIAMAPYGINGGNGVIVIETKKGRHSPLRITASAETGFSKILKNKFGLMNTQQKLNYELGIGIISPATYDERLPYSYNQIDEIFRTAWLQQYNLQLSGGNDNIDYYLSGGYYGQDGILENSDFKRYTINANINIQAAKWLKLGVNVYLGKENNTYPSTKESGIRANSTGNLVYAALMLNPYTPLRNADGSYNESLAVNPLIEATWFDNSYNATNIYGNAFFNVTFSPKFKLKSSIILSQNETKESIVQYYINNSGMYVRDENSETTAMIQTNDFSFSTYLDRSRNHWLSASLTEEYKVTSGFLIKRTHEMPYFNYSFSKLENEIKILSGSLKLDYDYKKRLFFSGIYRIDRFTDANENAESWALGSKWIAYENSYYSWFNRLSVKASMGKVTHLPIGNIYPNYTNPIAFNNPNNTRFDYEYMMPHGNTIWESTRIYNAGIEGLLFKEQLFLSAELYHKNTSDVLAFIPIYYNNQKGVVPTYQSEVQNKGIEFSARWDAHLRGDFYLSINANLSINYNKVKKLPYSEDMLNDVRILKEGEPLGSYYLDRWAGVDSNTGKAMWYKDETTTTTDYYDANKTYIENKSSLPSKYAGLMLNGGYKNVSLSAHFYGIWDIYTYNQNLSYVETGDNYYAGGHNLTTKASYYWKRPGDITDIQSPYETHYSAKDTRLLQNHSYFRLKSLTLSYDFSHKILRPLKVVEKCRLFVTAHNLFTLTNYRSFSPEVLGYEDNVSYPEARTFSWGIKLTFK